MADATQRECKLEGKQALARSCEQSSLQEGLTSDTTQVQQDSDSNECILEVSPSVTVRSQCYDQMCSASSSAKFISKRDKALEEVKPGMFTQLQTCFAAAFCVAGDTTLPPLGFEAFYALPPAFHLCYISICSAGFARHAFSARFYNTPLHKPVPLADWQTAVTSSRDMLMQRLGRKVCRQ